MKIDKLETKNGLYVINGSEIPQGHWMNELAEKHISEGGEITEWVEPEVDPKVAFIELNGKRKSVGTEIIDDVDYFLDQAQPNTALGIANLQALGTLETLLKRGDLKIAKDTLAAMDLTGTSFDSPEGETLKSEIAAMLETKIGELYP